jgi:hypothetical protein
MIIGVRLSHTKTGLNPVDTERHRAPERRTIMLNQHSHLLGRHALWVSTVTPTLKIEVIVLDVRSVFGRIECLVQPVSGTGKAWLSMKSLTIEEG